MTSTTRRTAVRLVLALATVLLAGCGGSSAPNTDTDARRGARLAMDAFTDSANAMLNARPDPGDAAAWSAYWDPARKGTYNDMLASAYALHLAIQQWMSAGPDGGNAVHADQLLSEVTDGWDSLSQAARAEPGALAAQRELLRKAFVSFSVLISEVGGQETLWAPPAWGLTRDPYGSYGDATPVATSPVAPSAPPAAAPPVQPAAPSASDGGAPSFDNLELSSGR